MLSQLQGTGTSCSKANKKLILFSYFSYLSSAAWKPLKTGMDTNKLDHLSLIYFLLFFIKLQVVTWDFSCLLLLLFYQKKVLQY